MEKYKCVQNAVGLWRGLGSETYLCILERVAASQASIMISCVDSERWSDPRRVSSMESSAHVLLLLDVRPGRGTERQPAVPGGSPALPSRVLALDRGPLQHQVFVVNSYGKRSLVPQQAVQ